jgi:hypothetical protein
MHGSGSLSSSFFISDVDSLCLSFLVCKIGIITTPYYRIFGMGILNVFSHMKPLKHEYYM